MCKSSYTWRRSIGSFYKSFTEHVIFCIWFTVKGRVSSILVLIVNQMQISTCSVTCYQYIRSIIRKNQSDNTYNLKCLYPVTFSQMCRKFTLCLWLTAVHTTQRCDNCSRSRRWSGDIYCVVCFSSIYGFWLPFWYLGIFKLFLHNNGARFQLYAKLYSD